jgi:hypothetical protein
LLLLQSDRILHMDAPVKHSAPFYIIAAIAVTAGGIIALKLIWELGRYVFGHWFGVPKKSVHSPNLPGRWDLFAASA